MAFIFVDDGAPEADEYANNYVWFEEGDAGAWRRATEEAERRQRARQGWTADSCSSLTPPIGERQEDDSATASIAGRSVAPLPQLMT